MSVKNPYKRKQFGTVVIAHRGGNGRAPESSNLAFEQAAAMPEVDALELDIHLTADGHIVVNHDDVVDRTTDGVGPVSAHTLYELQKLDAGYWWTEDDGKTYPFRGQGLYFPSLEEVLDRHGNKVINIDMKPKNKAIIKPFIALLRRYKMAESVVVGSFHNEMIAAFRKQAPEIATCATMAEVRRFYILNKLGLSKLYKGKSVAFQIPEMAENRTIVTKRFIRNLQKRGQQIHVWTVNDSADMQRLIEWGVDGIITDYPDQLLSILS